MKAVDTEVKMSTIELRLIEKWVFWKFWTVSESKIIARVMGKAVVVVSNKIGRLCENVDKIKS